MKPYKRKEIIGNCTLYLGDCLEVLPLIKNIDAIVTDPPYGVGFKYESFEDTIEYLKNISVKTIQYCISKKYRIILTPGNSHCYEYPKPDDIGVWFNPAGTGHAKWGFVLAHLIYYYGKDPKPNKSASSITGLFDRREKEAHPCIKPLPFIAWMVNKVSLVNETICDPFMGSGTTGVACQKLNRKFIGIEIDEKYFDIACNRIASANLEPWKYSKKTSLFDEFK